MGETPKIALAPLNKGVGGSECVSSITVAAMLPNDWKVRLVHRNVRLETDEDWDWCDLVIISAMIIQKEDFRELIGKGVRLGKKVVS